MSESSELYHVTADPVVNTVIQIMAERSAAGQAKYGHLLTRTDLSKVDWLRHAQEEALDLALYLQRLIDLEMQAEPAVKPTEPVDWSAA